MLNNYNVKSVLQACKANIVCFYIFLHILSCTTSHLLAPLSYTSAILIVVIIVLCSFEKAPLKYSSQILPNHGTFSSSTGSAG